ncbi:MAG TPA: hypothetical protein DIC52_01425, partial [Candidatus Latescibacteria bacterium]|nr:hypothetical protein [Candidatus Latescibacterota bacterium]
EGQELELRFAGLEAQMVADREAAYGRIREHRWEHDGDVEVPGQGLRFVLIEVEYPDHVKTGQSICGQVCVTDDPPGADDDDRPRLVWKLAGRIKIWYHRRWPPTEDGLTLAVECPVVEIRK